MENINERVNRNDNTAAKLLSAAFDGFMANLPILVCGTAVAMALVGDIFHG